MRPSTFFLSLLILLFSTGCGNGTEKEEDPGKKTGDPLKNKILEKKKDGHKTKKKEEVQYYDNGELKLAGKYKDGKRHGVWSSWYPNGQKKSEIIYQYGKPNGAYQTWYENGNLRFKGYFRRGEKVKVWKFYDKNGELVNTKDHSKQ